MSPSQLNVQASASHNAKQLPVALSAGRQQATVDRMAGDKRVQTEMGDLLGRARNTMGAHNFNTLQQELRRQRNAYGKDHIAELVWRTAVYDTDFRMLKAIVMPGGIWQEAVHGCWTQLELPMALLHAFGLCSKSLLHEAIVHAGKENMSEIVELIVAKNSSILSFRDAVFDDTNISELAITRRVPHSVVLSLSPKNVASLWEMDTPKGDPNPLRSVLQSLKKPGVTWKPVALSYYQTLRDQLQTRRNEVIEAKEAAKAAQELKKKKKQIQQQKQRQREDNLRLAKLVLDNLPEILTRSEWEENNQKDFEIKMAVLLAEDNIEALISNPQLAMSYNRRLCEGLLLAANNGKAAAVPGLMNVLRSMTWEKLSCSNQLQQSRIQLLENSIDQGQTAGVEIMLDMNAYLLGSCAKPPLCVAVQKQHPLNLVNMLLLPCKKYRPKGLEELDKECSALGYAMQAGQPELVEAIIPWTRMDHKFCLTMPDHDSKTADAGPRGAKQTRGKAQKTSTCTSIYPLMYALEVRQPSWLTSICSAAKAFFLLSADKVDCTQLETSYTDAAKGRVFSPEAEKACTEAMSQWADTSTGANNPPTALYRAIELEQVHAAEILLAAHANALKTICKGKDETTPLHKAIDIGNTRFVKHFAELWQEDVKAKRVMATALDTACNNVTPLLRAVQSQKFAIAELIVNAGADPLHTCKPAGKPNDKPCSPAPLTAVMDHIPAGDQKLERAGLSLITLMISKAAYIKAQLKGGKFKAELHASERQLIAEVGPALMYQAVSKSLLVIGAHLSRLNIDVTEVPADGVSDARSASPLLLLIEAAQEPRKGYNAAVADGNQPTLTVSSTARREAAKQMLQNVSNSWTISKTAKAAHPSMLPQDQQKILDWLFAHKQVTINKFTKGKAEQRLLVQQTIDANSLGLLRLLVEHVKLSCSNCFLHAIVADAPYELLVVLMKAAGGLDTAHPEFKSPLIHKAVEAGRMDVLQKLIGFGVMLKARDALGNTPLHVAVKFKDEAMRHQMTSLLLTHAPTLSKEINKKGQKPVDIISHKKKLRDWFEAVEQEVRLSQKDDAEKEHNEVADSVKTSSDDEGEEGDGLLLTRADESIEKRKRRITQLLQELPAVLKAAEEREAHAAAKVKASQAELPFPQKAKPGAEFDGMKSALMDLLPAELPNKDDPAPLQPLTAPAEEVAASMSEEQLVDSLIGLPWEFIINKDARQEWARMDRPFRLMVINRLQRIGEGQWEMDGGTEQRLSDVRGLEVYRTLLTRGGRIVFEVAIDYSQTAHIWKEMLRLWVITLDHEKYERELNSIAQGHSKSVQARDNMKLRAMRTADAAKCDLSARLPKVYEALGEDTDGQEERPRAEPLTDVELREHFPAASSSQDTYTLLKFYNLSKDLVRTVLQDVNDAEVDFPFRVSPSEQYIIENDPDPPCSIVLVGRSGTGKTTCAVFRMWARWLTFHHHSTEPFHQIFLTANPKLRSEVAKQFHRLRAAVLRDSEESRRLEELSKQDYSSLKNIPSDAFPLFWTTKQYLRAVDATLPEAPLGAGPFFPRLDGGALKYAEHAHNEEMGGIESMIDLDPGFAEDEDYESDDEQLEKGHSVSGHQEADIAAEKKGALGPKLEADYDFFVDVMWANISTKEEKQTMTPALVYQEICSFLKGSAEAMDSPGGKLSLQGYLDVGRKRAPNFNADTRREVYPIFERYEREKLRLNRYDHMDLLFHIYHSLKTNGYQGVPIHNITRDEVQDFTQAELLVDLRTMCDANGLFCCGDPCQTIARGIVFRFADICTLFHHESQRRKDAGGVAAATIVGVPKKPLHLPTNYRTHSGILNAAAAVVDVLRQYFPMHIDNLAREKAFFRGPPPLLLSSLSPDDLTFLLLGSDPKTSQVEFGAHQVILGRTADSLDRLPQHLLDSNVIKMTVAQAKGLEFDDVFLWDFFNGSPAEWRPLNNYVAHLAEVQETEGARKLPAGTPLVDVEVDPIDKGALRAARSADQHDVLLCEELKYLYTALTRAKNNVIIFDSNTAKRAPFFNYLRRLGMAQYVSRSVMEEHTDASRYVLTQGKNSSQDWVARGYNFMDNRLYDLAAHCFKVAEDGVRFTVATAFGKYLALKSKKSNVTSTESMQEPFKVGHDLLTAAGHADEATSAVNLTERKNWLNIAAKMFRATSEGKHIAARLFRELGNFKAAVAICTHLNDFAAAAEMCEEEAHMLAAREPARAEQKLQEAIRHHKKAKQHLQGFQLLQNDPTLFQNMAPDETNQWLQADGTKEVIPDSSVQADTPQKHVLPSWGDAKPDATRGTLAKGQAADVLEDSWDEEEDDILGDDDFTLVVKNKKKRGAGKGPARRRL